MISKQYKSSPQRKPDLIVKSNYFNNFWCVFIKERKITIVSAISKETLGTYPCRLEKFDPMFSKFEVGFDITDINAFKSCNALDDYRRFIDAYEQYKLTKAVEDLILTDNNK